LYPASKSHTKTQVDNMVSMVVDNITVCSQMTKIIRKWPYSKLPDVAYCQVHFH